MDVPILTPTVGLTFIELQAERNKQDRIKILTIFINKTYIKLKPILVT